MLTISMFKKGNKKRTKKQSGLVSLIIVSILAVVLGLVAIGFSKLMDREARQALDNELSAQAYYSAIAGLNDARAWLAATDAQYDLQGCSDWQTKPLGPSYFTTSLDGTGKTKYSCVSIDKAPSDLVYPINPDQSVTFSLNNQSMDKMYFGWENNPRPTSFVPLGASTGSLPQITSMNTNATGLLEVNIFAVPVGYTTQIVPGWPADTNSVLTALSRTYYMYPNSGAGNPGSVDYTAQNGNYVPGNCTTAGSNPLAGAGSTAAARMCNTFINNLNFQKRNWTYYVRLTARYAPINVTVQAQATNGSLVNQLDGAQAVVDVTGQGTDVLQRIRARVDLTKAYQTPTYGVQSMVEVCKGFNIEMQSQGTYGDAGNDPSISSYNYNSACTYPAGGGAVGSTAGDLPPHHGLPPVINPFPLVTATLTAVPTSIYTGQTSVLTWSSSGANSCTGVRISGNGPGFNTGGAANGSTTLSFSTAGTSQYKVTCTGFGGSADSNPVTITVNTPPAPTATISANPTSVWNNQSSTLTWSSTNATTCAGNGFSTGGLTSGSTSTGPLSAGSHTFSVTCTGPGGSKTSAPVTVTANVQTCSATATANATNGTATGSGSCNPAAYAAPQWTNVTVVTNNPCGENGTYYGTGNFVNWDSIVGTYKITFTIHGLYGGTGISNTVGWSRGGGLC